MGPRRCQTQPRIATAINDVGIAQHGSHIEHVTSMKVLKVFAPAHPVHGQKGLKKRLSISPSPISTRSLSHGSRTTQTEGTGLTLCSTPEQKRTTGTTQGHGLTQHRPQQQPSGNQTGQQTGQRPGNRSGACQNLRPPLLETGWNPKRKRCWGKTQIGHEFGLREPTRAAHLHGKS